MTRAAVAIVHESVPGPRVRGTAVFGQGPGITLTFTVFPSSSHGPGDAGRLTESQGLPLALAHATQSDVNPWGRPGRPSRRVPPALTVTVTDWQRVTSHG